MRAERNRKEEKEKGITDFKCNTDFTESCAGSGDVWDHETGKCRSAVDSAHCYPVIDSEDEKKRDDSGSGSGSGCDFMQWNPETSGGTNKTL